uniref:Uncharacterized protein n=1 Tax=Rhizophora mucronata TaxID=61149 RepID=A0A2P2P202_RHIMU
MFLSCSMLNQQGAELEETKEVHDEKRHRRTV